LSSSLAGTDNRVVDLGGATVSAGSQIELWQGCRTKKARHGWAGVCVDFVPIDDAG